MDPQALLDRFHFLGYRRTPEQSPLGKYFQTAKIPFEIVPLDAVSGMSDFLGLRVDWKQLRITLRQPTDQTLLICLIERPAHRSGLRAGMLDLVDFIDTLLAADLPIRYYGGCVGKIEKASPGELSPGRLADFYCRLLGGIVTTEHLGRTWMFADRENSPRFQNHLWKNRPGAAKWSRQDWVERAN